MRAQGLGGRPVRSAFLALEGKDWARGPFSFRHARKTHGVRTPERDETAGLGRRPPVCCSFYIWGREEKMVIDKHGGFCPKRWQPR